MAEIHLCWYSWYINNLSFHKIRNRWRTICLMAVNEDLFRSSWQRDDFRFLNRRDCKHLQREQWFLTEIESLHCIMALIMRRFLRVKKSGRKRPVQMIRIREINVFIKVQDDFNNWNGFNYFIPLANKSNSKSYFRIRSSRNLKVYL